MSTARFSVMSVLASPAVCCSTVGCTVPGGGSWWFLGVVNTTMLYQAEKWQSATEASQLLLSILNMQLTVQSMLLRTGESPVLHIVVGHEAVEGSTGNC